MSGEETRARFLAGIGAHLPVERVQEVHLFAPIRQGGMESGVAVIAVDLAPAPAAEGEADALAPVETEPSAYAETEPVAEADSDAEAGADAEPDAGDAELFDAPATPKRATRYTVYSARYRHTLKGPDRGKWEISVTDEADAPLLTVDAVVRGVTRRSGEADETVRLSGDEFRDALPRPVTP